MKNIILLVNGCGQCPQFVHRIKIFIIRNSINNIDNIRVKSSCGSGKKYKNCCGKN